jgi:hypothetical protein
MALALAVQAKSTNNAMAKVSAYIGLMSLPQLRAVFFFP